MIRNPLGKVRAGEALAAVLMLACVFLILSSYYAMKTSREGFILSESYFGISGQELKAYASAAMTCVLVAIVPLYGAIAERVRRIRLIDVSYAIVMASLVGFYALARAGETIGLALFVWIGLLNLFLVAQFWSYANDLYSEDQGQRLFPIIALGGSLGGVAGPRLATLASAKDLLLVSAVLLVPCVVLYHVIEHAHARDGARGHLAHEPIRGRGGFHLVRTDRYLTLIATLVFVGALVKTIGEYVLSDAAAHHAAQLVPDTAHANLAGHARSLAIRTDREEIIKTFYGEFFFWVNLVSFAVQALLVSLAIDKLGVRRALFVMPIVALGCYSLIAFIGGFALVRAVKIAENSTDYSLENTVRQTLFLPTDRVAKYKAKTAIDTFAVRAGDTVSALVIWIGVRHIGLPGRALAIVNVVLVGFWLVVALGIVRHHRGRTRATA